MFRTAKIAGTLCLGALCIVFLLADVGQTHAGSNGTVTLLSSGKSPKVRLRIRVNRGHTETTTVTLKIQMSAKSMGYKQSLPPMQTRTTMKVSHVQRNGDIRYTMKMGAGRVVNASGYPPAVVTAMNHSLATLRGMTGTGSLTNRGIILTAKYNIPTSVSAQTRKLLKSMEQGLRSAGMALPTQAVGVGARWTYAQVLNMGMKLNQTSTYEVVSISHDEVRLRVTVSQAAKNQRVSSAGSSVLIEKMTSRGSGTMTLKLGQLAPAKSSMTIRSSMAMKIPGGKRLTMLNEIAMQMTSR